MTQGRNYRLVCFAFSTLAVRPLSFSLLALSSLTWRIFIWVGESPLLTVHGRFCWSKLRGIRTSARFTLSLFLARVFYICIYLYREKERERGRWIYPLTRKSSCAPRFHGFCATASSGLILKVIRLCVPGMHLLWRRERPRKEGRGLQSASLGRL